MRVPLRRGEKIMRCADGHLFVADWVSRQMSAHLGHSNLMRCPVDGSWLMVMVITDTDRLTDAQWEQARSVKA